MNTLQHNTIDTDRNRCSTTESNQPTVFSQPEGQPRSTSLGSLGLYGALDSVAVQQFWGRGLCCAARLLGVAWIVLWCKGFGGRYAVCWEVVAGVACEGS